MRVAFTLLVLACLVAGCTATGQEDPFAYTRKPLYAGGFNLEKLAGANESQEFRVQDGSIVTLRLFVWVNATAGSASVTITDPSGRSVVSTSETMETSAPLNLGAWRTTVTAAEGSAGLVHILVVRA